MEEVGKFGTGMQDADLGSENPARRVSEQNSSTIDFELSSLSRLKKYLRDGDFQPGMKSRVSSHLRLEQLEMLEAELRNQSLLPHQEEGVLSLSQRLHHSINLLIWRARRLGVPPERLRFQIDLPAYVLSRAQEISIELHDSERREEAPGEAGLFQDRSGGWNARSGNYYSLVQELNYLECFAAYLLGEYDSNVNNYQRGLTLVLKVLGLRESQAKREQSEMISSSENIEKESRRQPERIEVFFPITVPQFTRLLKNQATTPEEPLNDQHSESDFD